MDRNSHASNGPKKMPIISASNFYGTENQTSKLMERLRKPLSEYVWKLFPLQKNAFEYADLLKSQGQEQICLFSFEPLSNKAACTPEQEKFAGGRKYVVTTYDDFWEAYQKLDKTCRHFYEVIREGSRCHLYFGKIIRI